MRNRRVAVVVGCLALIAVVIVSVTSRGKDPYYVVAYLRDAGGLRTGSVVTIGGVSVGRVRIAMADDDRVAVRLELDEGTRVGRDARFAIRSVNLLGQKRVDLDPGTLRGLAPSGMRIAASKVERATDLDQVLGVLDAPTREQLRVVLNEAGRAFFGRRVDVMRTLAELPADLRGLNAVLKAVRGGSTTISELVTRSDRFVGELAVQRRSLGSLVDTVGRTAETVSERRARLAETLQDAPRTLRTARAFAADLERTARPLGPAADQIVAVARPLETTLAALDPFTTAARPALNEARRVAPTLVRLADGATPVLREAVPTLDQLGTTATDLAPISKILRKSAQNIIATVDNWSAAVQGRDGLSHVFRAEASVSPQILDVILKRYTGTNLAELGRSGAKGAAAPRSRGGSDVARRATPRSSRPTRAQRPPASGFWARLGRALDIERALKP